MEASALQTAWLMFATFVIHSALTWKSDQEAEEFVPNRQLSKRAGPTRNI